MENVLLTADMTPKKEETVDVEVVAEPANNPLEGVEIDATPIASYPPSLCLNQPNRGRGRPRGSKNKLKINASLDSYGGAPIGVDFTAHPFIIQAGEDLYGRIIGACRATPAMTILSCNGTISRATISPNRNFGTITLTSQGPFEIVSLKGTDAANLSVSLADTRGKLYGGRVAGPMIAATPLQLIIGCYNQVPVKEKKIRAASESRPSAAAGTQEDGEVVGNPEAVTVAVLGSTDVGGEGAGFNN